jgi:response regulator of citrate/malate metabolism
MNSIRTIVVDDDHEVAGVHTGFLLAHGRFDVVGVAHTGARALELVGALRPQLVLLDIHLPDMSGIEVLRAARNLPGEPVDIIAITAARELETVRAAVAGGVLHYLVKPFNSQVLNQRLDAYVEYQGTVARHASVGADALDQHRIDQLLRPTGAAAAAAGVPHGPTPKGLSSPTLDAVVGDLRTCTAGAFGLRGRRAARHGAGQRPPLPRVPRHEGAGAHRAAVRQRRKAGEVLPVDRALSAGVPVRPEECR